VWRQSLDLPYAAHFSWRTMQRLCAYRLLWSECRTSIWDIGVVGDQLAIGVWH
jgi:hypothetical protein